MKLVRTIAATLSVAAMLLVGATSLAPVSATQQGEWEAVCCGPQCVINGEQEDYCVGSGDFECCKETVI